MPTDPLLDPSARVPSPTGDAPLAVARRAMARWSNGEQHVVARDIAVGLVMNLSIVDLRASARAAAAAELSSATDLVPVARLVPVMVLADALGFTAPRFAAHLQRVVTLAIAPEDGSAPADAHAIDSSLAWLLASSGAPTFEEAANRIALLHQCLDATAALITLAMLRSAREPGETAAALVAGVLHDEPPVMTTVRIDAGGVASTVPLAGRPFGAGAHRCPGDAVAIALAEGVVEAMLASGRRPVDGPAEFERRPHLRIPRSLPLLSP